MKGVSLSEDLCGYFGKQLRISLDTKETRLKKYGEGKIDENNYMNLPEQETLDGLAAYLGIPEKQGKVFLVNGSPRTKEYKLSEEDEVKILGFIGGG